jgi:prepilin-type N-terminal cleavage/methylation domain-containing protein
MINTQNNNFGFTLIELLVVIAIIGILSAIAVINLSGSKYQAGKQAMMEQMRNIVPLIQTCISSNQQICADCQIDGGDMVPAAGDMICAGQTWPEPIKGWSWKYYWQYNDTGEWGFASLSNDTGENLRCSQANANSNFQCITD